MRALIRRWSKTFILWALADGVDDQLPNDSEAAKIDAWARSAQNNNGG